MVIERAMSLYDTFASFFDELINDGMEVVGLFVGCELAISTGAFLEDAVGIFDFLAATQFVDHITQKPFDQFADEVTGGHFFLFTKVDQLAVQAVAMMAWKSAAMQIASSTRVQTSQMRNSSVGYE